MEGIPAPAERIFRAAIELADRTQDQHLIDCITVTQGYAELLQMNPSNERYKLKLSLSLQQLMEANLRVTPAVTN
jgi:hypothetical protein